MNEVVKTDFFNVPEIVYFKILSHFHREKF